MASKATVLGALAILLLAIPSAGQAPAPSAAPATSKTADASPAPAQAPMSPEQARLVKPTEAFVRQLFGWGPEIKLSLGPFGQSTAADFYVVPIQVTLNDQTETGEVYVSKDGKALLRGELFDMSADPFAANRAKMHI